MTTIAQLIERIESRQPVLNSAALSTQQRQALIEGVGALDSATATQLSFLSSPRYKESLKVSRAGAVLVDSQHQAFVPDNSIALVVASPYLAYASCSQLFEINPVPNYSASSHIHPTATISKSAKIHPTAVIDRDVVIEEGVQIGPYCVIDSGSSIGSGSRLISHAHIGLASSIGEQCLLYPHVVIGHHCQVGNAVRIHAHASIGQEGFGFAPTGDPATSGWERIAQLGRVIIGNHVRIGSQTCIDRGAIADTRISDHVIIDNLVQIAHNVTIGEGTAIAANTGIAGSVNIGKRCIIAGAVGITGHLTITDDVTITAMTMVTKSLTQPGSYSSGTVAMPSAKWRRAAVRFRQVE